MVNKLLFSTVASIFIGQSLMGVNFEPLTESECPKVSHIVKFSTKTKTITQPQKTKDSDQPKSNSLPPVEIIELGSSEKSIDIACGPEVNSSSVLIPIGFPLDANDLIINSLVGSIETWKPAPEGFGYMTSKSFSIDKENQREISRTTVSWIKESPKELLTRLDQKIKDVESEVALRTCQKNQELMDIIRKIYSKNKLSTAKESSYQNLKEVALLISHIVKDFSVTTLNQGGFTLKFNSDNLNNDTLAFNEMPSGYKESRKWRRNARQALKGFLTKHSIGLSSNQSVLTHQKSN